MCSPTFAHRRVTEIQQDTQLELPKVSENSWYWNSTCFFNANPYQATKET